MPAARARLPVLVERHPRPARTTHHRGQLLIDGTKPMPRHLIVTKGTRPQIPADPTGVGNDIAVRVPVHAPALGVEADPADLIPAVVLALVLVPVLVLHPRDLNAGERRRSPHCGAVGCGGYPHCGAVGGRVPIYQRERTLPHDIAGSSSLTRENSSSRSS